MAISYKDQSLKTLKSKFEIHFKHTHWPAGGLRDISSLPLGFMFVNPLLSSFPHFSSIHIP